MPGHSGQWWVGIAGRGAGLEALPSPNTHREIQDRQHLWGWHSHDPLWKERVGAGTVIGVSYDQSSGPPTVNFFIDGELVDGAVIFNVKGQVHPACGVSSSALDCNFTHDFVCPPPEEYHSDGVMSAAGMM